MSSRHDPFGDYDHLVPVSIEQASAELLEADKALGKLIDEYTALLRTVQRVKHAQQAAHAMVQEKQFLLVLSARNTTPKE